MEFFLTKKGPSCQSKKRDIKRQKVFCSYPQLILEVNVHFFALNKKGNQKVAFLLPEIQCLFFGQGKIG